MTEAAGVTFYSLLAMFPAMAALISLYGLFADPHTVSDHLAAMDGLLPGGGLDIIKEQVKSLTSGEPKKLGFGVLFGFAASVWSANQGIKSLFDALNIVNDEKETRGFLHRTALTLAFTLGALLFIVLALVAVVAVPAILAFVGLGGVFDFILRFARWPVLLAAIGLFLAFLYRFGPSRDRAQWRWVSWGSAVAAIGFVAFSLGFSYYVANFGNYNETYGSLGAVIGFMTWVWLSSTVVLAGAELDAEMEHQTARDTTTGPERPMGARGAKMADTVA
jgi:membrane protein